MSASRHGWNEFGNYLLILEGRLQRLEDEGFVTSGRHSDNFEAVKHTEKETIIISGRIICAYKLFIDVEEELAVMERAGRLWVQLVECRYHAGVLGEQARASFRYDNAHAYPGHPDAFHKHQFDPVTWQQPGWPIWIGREHWPSPGDVLEELRQWWEATGQLLDLDSNQG